MEDFIAAYLSEIIISGVAGMVAWGFRSWSTALKETTNKILSKLEYLTQEFHAHKVDVERRVTRVETKVDIIHGEDIERIISTRERK